MEKSLSKDNMMANSDKQILLNRQTLVMKLNLAKYCIT